MTKNYHLLLTLLPSILLAQFDPPAGQAGSKAIFKNDPLFKSWATEASVVRGPQDIAASTVVLASVGTAVNATGIADGSGIVSLGDGGTAVLTFAKPITNGSGADFAVFENSFNDTFLELAFVEASSDGINFFRFPATSLTSTGTQVGSFGATDATKINNLAGKYKANYGTPFDISELPDHSLLNKDKITHVKIIDVVGTINPQYGTLDSVGNIVNDPYPTNFASGGFDLDAVGVINEFTEVLATANLSKSDFQIYPNPTSDFVQIKSREEIKNINVYSITGQKVIVSENEKIDLKNLPAGNYLLEIITAKGKITKKIIKK